MGRSKCLIIGLWVGLLSSACQPYKPSGYAPVQRVAGSQQAAGNENAQPGASPYLLALASSQLAASPAPYDAQISFQESRANPAAQQAAPATTITRSFSAAADAPVKIDLGGLPTDVDGLLTVLISQNKSLKFIAKRAHTRLMANQNQTVIIDDCLIQAAPWNGADHKGSCEWTIEDVN